MATYTFQDIPVAEPATTTTVATIKAQALANMAAITVSPKPSYTIDGQTISWGEYLTQLQRTIDWCNEQAAVDEPFEIVSQGYSP
jgi:biopolymer transport protein ExbD